MNLRSIKTGFLVGASFLASAAVLHAQGFQSYESKAAGISVQYPAGWIKSETVQGALVAFGVPKEKANLKMVENVAVFVQELPKETSSLEKYTAMYEAQRRNDPNGPKVVESKKAKLAGLPAHQMVLTAKQNGLDIKFLQVWTVKNGKAYLMTYGAAADKYKNFIKEAEGIIGSLKFI